MCRQKTVNLFDAGFPFGKGSVARFDWQCKTLAVWCESTEECIRQILEGFVSSEAKLLRAKFMRISAERFGENKHPYLYEDQMTAVLYPVLVHAVDVIAELKPNMECVRPVADQDSLCEAIQQMFKQMIEPLPSRFVLLLATHEFDEAFETLCSELETMVEQSNKVE